jgi:hypothetical protein
MQTIDLLTAHPSLQGTTRKAVIHETYSNHKAKFSSLTVQVDNYQNGVLVQNDAVGSYQVVLRADNSVFVNPLTGDYVPADTEGAMGEYDYIDYLETQNLPFSNQQFKENIVLRAEQQGRFDK